jgi:ERCC4-type nuclease
MIDVIIDTREQLPYVFSDYIQFHTISKKLDTGDYSIVGLEDKFCLERKKSITEFAGNITQTRFADELRRMSKIAHPFILLEFSFGQIDRYPEGCGLSQKVKDKIKIRAPYILKCMAQIQIQYGIHIIMCGCAAYGEVMGASLIKRINEKYN